jgi:hypothetical protein
MQSLPVAALKSAGMSMDAVMAATCAGCTSLRFSRRVDYNRYCDSAKTKPTGKTQPKQRFNMNSARKGR